MQSTTQPNHGWLHRGNPPSKITPKKDTEQNVLHQNFGLSYHLKVVLNLDTEKSPFFLRLPKPVEGIQGYLLAIHPQPWQKLHLHRDSGTPPGGCRFFMVFPRWFTQLIRSAEFSGFQFVVGDSIFSFSCRGYDSFLDFFLGGIFLMFLCTGHFRRYIMNRKHHPPYHQLVELKMWFKEPVFFFERQLFVGST